MLIKLNTVVLGLIVATWLTACADPMSATDSITPYAGMSKIHNAEVHTFNPNAGYGSGNPGGSGPRAATVIAGYKSGGGN